LGAQLRNGSTAMLSHRVTMWQHKVAFAVALICVQADAGYVHIWSMNYIMQKS